MRRLERSAPALWCLAAAVLFGGSTPIAKVLLQDLGPFSLAGFLYLGAAGAVLPFSRIRGVVTGGDRTDRWRLGGIVVFGGVLAPVLLFVGLQSASASTVSLWLNLETAITVVLAAAFFREHLGRHTWWAVAFVSLGSLLLVWPVSPGTASAAVLVALACTCWGIDNNLTALIQGVTPAQATLVKGLGAGVFNLAIGLWWEPGSWRVSIVAVALVVGVVSYGLSLVLHTNSAQHLGAARAQTIFGTAPFWGVALSWTILSEPPSLQQVLAGAMMMIALWLTRTEEHAHAHTHTALVHTHAHRHDDGHHAHAHAEAPSSRWHIHEHVHEAANHAHDHAPDLHHRHEH